MLKFQFEVHQFKLIMNSLTVEERAESLEYGDGTEACVLSKTQLHEHEREPDQQQHAHERDQERACNTNTNKR